VAGIKVDFSNVRSTHSEEVLGVGAPRTRKVLSSLSRISDDPEKLAGIKSYIKEEMLKGKVRTLYPYSLNALLGFGSDGITIPYTKGLHIGFVKIPLASESHGAGYLSVSCLSEPFSLRNPECYHHFHIFVE